MKKGVSRRAFLKGTAASAVGASAALTLLSSCTSGESIDKLGEGSGQGVIEGPSADKTYGSILNPQEDFSKNERNYESIFSPLQIGGITLKNRLVKSCAGSEMQKSSEWPDDSSMNFYEQFCQGGVGMICFESSNVIPKPTDAAAEVIPGAMEESSEDAGGIPILGILDISDDAGIPAHQAIADNIHQYDVPVIAQMYDMTMAGGGSSTKAEMTKLETSFNPGIMQTTEEVQAEQKHFIEAAIRYYKAGFDGIELNCSCNHYFSTYLSRFNNTERTDQYSGETIENRARIVTEIIEGIRKEVGDDFIIQVLYSGIEENVSELGDNSLCTTIDEGCEFAKLFEKAGASSLHIRSQAYGHHCGGFMPDVLHYFEHGDTGYHSVIDYSKHFNGVLLGQYNGVGALLDVAARIKTNVSIPVGVVGCMDPRLAPDLLDQAIADGKADFFLMTRPLMADPAIAKKLEEGKRDEVAPCAHCMTCFVAPFDFGMPMYCRVNPAITRAYSEDMPEGYEPLPCETPKDVMVVGSGPAGMEAARIAAQRGHHVALYEKKDELGGLMGTVQKIKGPHEGINDHRDYLKRQIELYGVEVSLNQEVDAFFVESKNPDIVVVATGGLAHSEDSLASHPEVLNMQDIESSLDGNGLLSVGEKIVIIGAQFQACEIAAHLARQGKSVTMLNPGPENEIYMNGATWPRIMGKAWLKTKGVKIYNEVEIQEVTDNKIVFNVSYMQDISVDFDNIIQASPLSADKEFVDSISSVCDVVYSVGDCYSPNNIAAATAKANITARRLGEKETDEIVELAENQSSATAVGYGEITVIITVEGGIISEAIVDTSNETEGIGRELGPQFAQQIVEKGSVDAVSGATLTSDGVDEALRECLTNAGF